MATRNIRIKGDELLRKKAKKVPKITDSVITLLDDMAETMYAASGAGLAAPQVGILKRIVVIDIGDGIREFINPEIIEAEGEQIGEEGCLSVPGETGYVIRPKKVKVKAEDRNGEEFTLEGDDFLAVAICHELDHLDGVLYIDKLVEQPEEDVE